MGYKVITQIVCTLFVSLALQHDSYAQGTEIRINAYSGLFSFQGEGANSTSRIIFNPYTSPSIYTFNPHGKKSQSAYSIEAQVQRVTNNATIYGAGLSFERLSSRIEIDTFSVHGFIYTEQPAAGKTYLTNSFLTLNPYLGHRYTYRNISFDFVAGIDLAFCLKSKEEGSARVSDELVLTTDHEIDKPLIDFRPRIQVNTQYKNVGFLVGYSLGLTGYRVVDSPKAFSRFLRLGLSYKVN
jgi:hypothetical protein